jgi:hypothetical protein
MPYRYGRIAADYRREKRISAITAGGNRTDYGYPLGQEEAVLKYS